MPIEVQGKTFYRTKEALEKIGISRPTWFRWMKDKVVEDVKHKDRKGWRLFTDDDIKRISNFAFNLDENPQEEKL